jgi:hypothetical protein
MTYSGGVWDISDSLLSPTSPKGSFNGVSVASPTNAWAVGSTGDKTLIERWNGNSWSIKSSVNPGSSQVLNAVSGSLGDLWAVGAWNGPGPNKNLVEHWNGTSWSMVTVPNPGTSRSLLGVDATSSTIWAVGSTSGGSEILGYC